MRKPIHYKPAGYMPICLDAEHWKQNHKSIQDTTNIYRVTCSKCLLMIANTVRDNLQKLGARRA